MDCREAQALIVPFIEGKLTDEQTETFIQHIENCTDCYDELEVYYIVMVGVKQLDEDEHMLVDFKGDLKKYISYKKEQIAKKHSRSTRLKLGGVAVFILLLCAGGFAWYNVYSHPDITARYIGNISSAVNVDLHSPSGETKSFITRNARDYFINNSFDMPLRRIQTVDEEGT
ncbi:hypothetical protein HNP82_000907 [Catenibacillus scindens]|uniref:Putative zinc-finger domain-containing protein n=1 Tax=Catenibacillus scindens TaxID=673271 RepID=A0A7W8H8L6_9FIRM|nr:zf-HC2 domain-containing protein [Catenibacillus scindens]MBB5263809.1 hypothetical protein [Catenibacillus scindens]